MPHLRPDEGNSCCKQPPLVKESSGFLLARLNSIGSVDSFISPDQLLKSAGSWSSHSWSTALKENSRVPAAAAFTAGDVLVRSSPVCKQVASPVLSHKHQTVPFNDISQAVDFETPLFKGKVLVMMQGLPNTPASVFEGRRRLMWMAVQGRFKQPVGLDSLMLGSDFERPLKLPAGGLLSKASMWLVQRMGSGVQLNTAGANPHILAPLIAAAQVVNVSRPGQEPGLLDAEEDMTLYNPSLVSSWTGKPLSAAKRRGHFSCKSGRQGRLFDTDNVWTFQVYDHVMDYSTFTLPVPFFRVDLVQVLDGQPMQLLLKDMASNTPMLKLEVWHKRMLEHKANFGSASSTSTTATTSSSQHCSATATAAAEGCVSGCSTPRSNHTGGRLSRSGSLQAATAALVKG